MICSVGLTCVDIVSFLPNYPLEDSDQRCTRQSWERGGNASNNATVLACLGAFVEYFGTLADDNLLSFLNEDMDSLGIKHNNCPVISCGGNGPISVVLCSEETGSRTIVHAKGNLPELSLEHFQSKLDISQYKWIHFEGRNELILPSVLEYVNQYNIHNSKGNVDETTQTQPKYKSKAVPVSIEVEKHRASLEALLPLADVVLVGKDFAMLQGAQDCIEAAKIISSKVTPGTVVICAWGDQGATYCVATANSSDLSVMKQDAYIPDKIIDSLGAGDTFNATVIYGLYSGLNIAASVRLGCQIASEKLKIRGFKGIKQIAPKYLQELGIF